MIKNISIRDVDGGEFDYRAEGYPVEIVEVFEDAVEFVNLNGHRETRGLVKMEGDTAILKGDA